MSFIVLRAGALSTFQDRGRMGLQHLGVPVGGAMDERSHRLANLLVGNAEDTATLEVTLLGPRLAFTRSCCVALCGATLEARRGNEPMPMNRPIVLRSGDVLDLGGCRRGARAYLAVHGGFALPRVMGSQSTAVRGGFGGWQGRALRKGDEVGLCRPLPEARAQGLAEALWAQRLYLSAPLSATPRRTVRILRSAQWRQFTPESCAAFLAEPWRIGADSERMGYRLEGPALQRAPGSPAQMVSEGQSFGTIQVPAGGQPIVLMADHGTTGGYPKIAHVISADLPLLAQMPPGATVRFEATTLPRAQALDLQRERHFAKLARDWQPVRELLAQHGEPR